MPGAAEAGTQELSPGGIGDRTAPRPWTATNKPAAGGRSYRMALIITRRVGETVCIAEDVLVTVAEIFRGSVRLAFDAPRTVEVDRLEIRRRKRRASRKALVGS